MEPTNQHGYNDPQRNLTEEDVRHLDRIWAAFDDLREHLGKRFPHRQSPIRKCELHIEGGIKAVAFHLATTPSHLFEVLDGGTPTGRV